VLLVVVVVLEIGPDNSFAHLRWNPIEKLCTNKRVQGISNLGPEIVCFFNILIACMRINASVLTKVT
jgi:hypothetical protein